VGGRAVASCDITTMSAMILPRYPCCEERESIRVMPRVQMKANGSATSEPSERCVRARIWRFAGGNTKDINSLS
jgi:hypothetical protein